MKVYLMLLTGLFVGNLVSAQCRFEIDRVDPFTNHHEKLTEALVIARKVKRTNALPLRKVMVQLKNFNNFKTFVLKFPLTAVMSPTFNDTEDKSHVVLLLDNKKRIKLPLAQLMGNQAEGVELRYAIDFSLTNGDIKQLKINQIRGIRVAMKVNTFDITLEKTAAKILLDYFNCMD